MVEVAVTDQTGIEFRAAGSVTVAVVNAAELAPACTDALLGWLERADQADCPPRLVVDLGRVKFIDSVALGSLVVLLRRVNKRRGRLALAGLVGHPMKMMQVTGLAKVFAFFTDVPSAVAALEGPGG